MSLSKSLSRWLIPAIFIWLFLGILYVYEPSFIRFHRFKLRWFLPSNKVPLPGYIERARPRHSEPNWCSGLMKEPRERERTPGIFDCGRDRYAALCSDGKARFFSQYNQDIFLYMNHFRHLTRRGVYLDIATNEPVRISNTYFFDACLGWEGVCVEANDKYYKPIRITRSCALVRACVSDTVHNATFVVQDGLSGLEATNKNARAWRANNVMHLRKRINVKCVRASDALTPLGIAHIDLLSLDVEGHEFHVLNGINWNITHINVIVMESSNSQCERLLRTNGFTPLHLSGNSRGHGHLLSDVVYIHKSVKWGKPI